jgi:hypothetical protein
MDQTAILREYQLLRNAAVALNTRLVQSLSREDLDAAVSALGVGRGRRIELETEDELCVVMDHAIHDVYRDGLNAVDRLLKEDPPAQGSAEMRVLRSLQNSHYTLFRVQTLVPGFGVRGLAGTDETPTLLVDLGFSATATPGMALATRLQSPGEGWWMTTGAALPLDGQTLDRIIHVLEDHLRQHGECTEQQRTAMIMRSCIASGASRHIRYAAGETIAPNTALAPVRNSPKVGRNDPCPCGSGKKYKKCCGN